MQYDSLNFDSYEDPFDFFTIKDLIDLGQQYPYTRMPETEQVGSKKRHPLDSDKMEAQRRKLMALYEDELDRQSENRHDQAIDEDFYDNIQWREEDARVLKDRGQVPLVYNVISSSVNWVLGTEKRGRSDYKILPRRKDASKPAERKTQLMKYLSDVNRTPFHRSRAFEDAVKVGLGWMESGVQDEDDGEPVYNRYESWRNILWDSACTEKDLSMLGLSVWDTRTRSTLP